MDRKMTVIASIMAVAALLVLWTVACAPEGPGSETAPFTGCRLVATEIGSNYYTYGNIPGYTVYNGSTATWVPPSVSSVPLINDITIQNLPYCHNCENDNCSDVFIEEVEIEYIAVSAGAPALSPQIIPLALYIAWDGEDTVSNVPLLYDTQTAQLAAGPAGQYTYSVVLTLTGVNAFDYEAEMEISVTLEVSL